MKRAATPADRAADRATVVLQLSRWAEPVASDWQVPTQAPEQPLPDDGTPTQRPPDEHFRRAHRLRLARDFARIRREGRSVAGARLTLAYVRRATPPAPAAFESSADSSISSLRPQPPDPTRVGFIVGKRVGGAVVRNRVRRRLREQVRRRLHALRPGYDLAVIARPSAATASAADLARDLEALFQRARVLAPPDEQAT